MGPYSELPITVRKALRKPTSKGKAPPWLTVSEVSADGQLVPSPSGLIQSCSKQGKGKQRKAALMAAREPRKGPGNKICLSKLHPQRPTSSTELLLPSSPLSCELVNKLVPALRIQPLLFNTGPSLQHWSHAGVPFIWKPGVGAWWKLGS